MNIIKYVKSYLLIILIACILLTIASAIPKTWVAENIWQGLKVLEKEGTGPVTNLGYHAILDNFTDSVMFNTIYSLDELHPFQSSMNAINIIVPDENMGLGDPIISLRNLLENEERIFI